MCRNITGGTARPKPLHPCFTKTVHTWRWPLSTVEASVVIVMKPVLARSVLAVCFALSAGVMFNALYLQDGGTPVAVIGAQTTVGDQVVQSGSMSVGARAKDDPVLAKAGEVVENASGSERTMTSLIEDLALDDKSANPAQ